MKIQKSQLKEIIKEVINEQRINETLPAFPREWKNLEKAEKLYEKAIIDLGKAVAKQDRKKGQLIPALYKTLNATMKKFKEMLNTEILSKLQ